MGWLGWTEAETLDSTMQAIEEAYRGRVDMLQAIFGGGKKGAGISAKDGREVAGLFRSLGARKSHQ